MKTPSLKVLAWVLPVWAASVGAAWWLGSRQPARIVEVQVPAAPAAAGGTTLPTTTKSATAVAEAEAAAEDMDEENGAGGGHARTTADAWKLVRDAEAMPPGPERDGRIMSALGRLTKYDPAAAMEYAQGIEGVKLRAETLEHILGRWAKYDPEAAWKKISETNDGTLPENRVGLVLQGLAKGDPTKALSFLWEHKDELQKHRDEATYTLDMIYQNGGHKALESWIPTLPEGKWRDTAVNRFIDEFARYDPAGAKRYLESSGLVTSGNLGAAQVELAESWARVRPDEAMKWVQGLPTNQQNKEVYDAVLRRWLQYDKNKAAEWLSTQPPSPVLDRSIERYTYDSLRLDPASSMPWAETITDPERRFNMMNRVAEEWGRRDPRALAGYVQNVNLPADKKERLLKFTQPVKR